MAGLWCTGSGCSSRVRTKLYRHPYTFCWRCREPVQAVGQGPGKSVTKWRQGATCTVGVYRSGCSRADEYRDLVLFHGRGQVDSAPLPGRLRPPYGSLDRRGIPRTDGVRRLGLRGEPPLSEGASGQTHSVLSARRRAKQSLTCTGDYDRMRLSFGGVTTPFVVANQGFPRTGSTAECLSADEMWNL